MNYSFDLFGELDLRQFLTSFPVEWRDDLYQEAAVACLEHRDADPGETESPLLSCRRAVQRAFSRMTNLVDLLPHRTHRRVYAELKDQAGYWTSQDAEALARLYRTRPEVIRHVLMVINSRAEGPWMSLESLNDTPAPETEPAERELQMRLIRCVGLLNERDAEIVQRRYLSDEPESQAELAEDFGVSQPRINQLEKRALARLRELLTAPVS